MRDYVACDCVVGEVALTRPVDRGGLISDWDSGSRTGLDSDLSREMMTLIAKHRNQSCDSVVVPNI